MIELPDRRAVWLMLCVISVGFVHVVALTVNERGLIARVSEFALYASIAILGAVLAFLSLRDGFNLVRPSRTRESLAFSFWVDVLVLCPGLPLAGAWFAWKAYAHAS